MPETWLHLELHLLTFCMYLVITGPCMLHQGCRRWKVRHKWSHDDCWGKVRNSRLRERKLFWKYRIFGLKQNAWLFPEVWLVGIFTLPFSEPLTWMDAFPLQWLFLAWIDDNRACKGWWSQNHNPYPYPRSCDFNSCQASEMEHHLQKPP